MNAIVQIEASAWGVVARYLSISCVCLGHSYWKRDLGALFIDARGMAASLGAARRFPLTLGTGAQYEPGAPWLAPVVVSEPEPEEGPVLVVVEYQIDSGRAEEFTIWGAYGGEPAL